MKNKLVVFIVILALGLVVFSGCTKASEYKAEKAVNTFIAQRFNIDYVSSAKLHNSIIESLDNVETVHEDFKPIMTEDALERFIANRSYLNLVQFNVMNKCSLVITKIDLKNRVYDKENEKISYDYIALFKIVYENNNPIDEGVEEGTIRLVLDENQWKVDSLKITKFPEVLKKKMQELILNK